MLATTPEKDPFFDSMLSGGRCPLRGEIIRLRHCLTNGGHHEEVSFWPRLKTIVH